MENKRLVLGAVLLGSFATPPMFAASKEIFMTPNDPAHKCPNHRRMGRKPRKAKK